MSKTDELAILILAAGKGTRMKSRVPKVLHPICGRPMLHYPLTAAEHFAPRLLRVVVGHEADAVCDAFAGRADFVVQSEQRGTGHAVLQCRESLEGFSGDVVIMYGDTPLLRSETIAAMARHKQARGADVLVLSAEVPVPGIVIRGASGAVERIVEVPDATPAQLAITERNTGVYLLSARPACGRLLSQGRRPQCEQGELYLTDIVRAVRRGRESSVEALDARGSARKRSASTRVPSSHVAARCVAPPQA